MSSPHGAPASFLTRLFESPLIKSWKPQDSAGLRRALTTALDGIAQGSPLILDLLVDIESVMLEPVVEAANVIHWRSRPSKGFGARARRLLGFYSGESTLAAAVQVTRGAEVDALLVGDTLWDCEFTIYPPPDRPLSELPDPHFDVPGFSGHVPWAIMQDSASDSWMVTARDEADLRRVSEALLAAFTALGLPATLATGPDVERSE